MSFSLGAAIAQFASTGPSTSVTDTFGPIDGGIVPATVTSLDGTTYVDDIFYSPLYSYPAQTVDLSSVLAGVTSPYITIRYFAQPATKFALYSAGPPSAVTYSHGPPGKITPAALLAGWQVLDSIGQLEFSTDTYGTVDVGAEDISGPSYSLQPYDPSFSSVFSGYLLRPTALTWAGQDPANDGNRALFLPSDLSSVEYDWLSVAVGKLSTLVTLTIDTYDVIPSPSFSTGLMCVL